MNKLELLKTGLKAIELSSNEILTIYNRHIDIEIKGDGSPLTNADLAANKEINRILSTSNLPIISEEIKNDKFDIRKKWSKYWLVDPIDGTKGFIKKNDEFTINIALVENNNPSIGIVYVPVSGILYIGFNNNSYKAVKGIDFNNFDELINKLNDSLIGLKKISVNLTPNSPIKIIGSRNHLNEETEFFISKLKDYFDEVEIVSVGSSLKICLVAEGKADIYPRLGVTNEWDIAAAHAILKFAGGNLFVFDKDLPISSYINRSEFPSNLKYNKESLKNPYFIVSGLHKYNM